MRQQQDDIGIKSLSQTFTSKAKHFPVPNSTQFSYRHFISKKRRECGIFMPSNNTPIDRLQAISSHLQPKPQPQPLNMASRDPITCHVLDTIKGRPGANISVVLISHVAGISEATFSAVTNFDGRVANWTATEGSASIADVFSHAKGGNMVWSLKFDTGAYYGEGNTFWPEVELKFFVKEGEHYHVPLLLGPWSYTTYRGS